MIDYIPFNRPYMTGQELENIGRAHANGHLSGDGPFTRHCSDWLTHQLGCHQTLLTHSCTAALEMTALLLDLKAGDEVIMPSFTFVSTANAFVLRGAVPVFVDIRSDTLNLDEALIEQAITDRTRAIVPVHYAGVSCEMDSILEIARAYRISVIEDAAQGINATYKGQALGTMGDLGCLSFHETKNISCGEGGALMINRPELLASAEIIREKGTNRSSFRRGQIDKYSWVDCGSSYLPSELNAAFLSAQLRQISWITSQRLRIWDHYHRRLASLEAEGLLQRPAIPADCTHNAHIYYVVLPKKISRPAVLARLEERGINAVSHYVPLHSAKGGRKYGKSPGPMHVTDDLSARLVRLPVWVGLSEQQIDFVVKKLTEIIYDEMC